MGGSCSPARVWMWAGTAQVSPAVLGCPRSSVTSSSLGLPHWEGSTDDGKEIGCLTHCPPISPLLVLSVPFPGG